MTVDVESAVAQCPQRFLPRDLRMIVSLAEMRQHQMRGAPVVLLADELADGSVREMPETSHQPLLENPRIRPDSKHFQIVIGFQDQAVRAHADVSTTDSDMCPTSVSCVIRMPLAEDAERHRLIRIVRHRERRDFGIADRERNSRRDRNDLRAVQFEGFRLQSSHRSRREICLESLSSLSRGPQPGPMIVVLVRDRGRRRCRPDLRRCFPAALPSSLRLSPASIRIRTESVLIKVALPRLPLPRTETVTIGGNYPEGADR